MFNSSLTLTNIIIFIRNTGSAFKMIYSMLFNLFFASISIFLCFLLISLNALENNSIKFLCVTKTKK